MMVKQPPYENNVLSYNGPISIGLVSFVSNYIKEVIREEQRITSKIYKVFIELVQNISYYSADTYLPEKQYGAGKGWFSIQEKEKVFVLTTGNLIHKSHGPILERNCSEINSLDEKQLRDLKRRTRKQSNIKDIGAHIGLIHTGLISGNPLEIDISEVDSNYSFFKIQVEIDK